MLPCKIRNFYIIFTKILFKLFDPNSECFAEYDAFCLHIFDYACLRRNRYQRIFETMEKLYISKTCLKMTDGRMHTPHHRPLHPPPESGIF